MRGERGRGVRKMREGERRRVYERKTDERVERINKGKERKREKERPRRAEIGNAISVLRPNEIQSLQ